MKIIFLDIDGVLNSQDWSVRRFDLYSSDEMVAQYPKREFDPEAIDWLNYIVENTGAKVVVSSTWRLGRRVEDLRELLESVGFEGEVIDKTPNMHARIDGEFAGYRPPRGCEIDWWLEKQGGFQRVNWSQQIQQEFIDNARVKNYVILDDDSDMLYNQREHFIKTDAMHGLTKVEAERAINILNKSLIDLYY